MRGSGPAALSDPEEQRARPMYAGDLPGDLGQRTEAPAPILEAFLKDDDRVHVLVPLANQLGARPQCDGRSGTRSALLVSAFGKRAQLSPDAQAQTAVRLFLDFVGNSTHQQITAQPGRRRHSIEL